MTDLHSAQGRTESAPPPDFVAESHREGQACVDEDTRSAFLRLWLAPESRLKALELVVGRPINKSDLEPGRALGILGWLSGNTTRDPETAFTILGMLHDLYNRPNQ